MFMKVAAIVFLLLIRLRFPHSKSLSQIIRRQYGDKIIKRLHKFETTDYRLWKAELDLEFLVKCRDNKVIPKFLDFHLANRSLRFSLTYAHWQSNLLLEEKRLKKSKSLRERIWRLTMFTFVQSFWKSTTLSSNQIVLSSKRSFATS